MSASSFLIPKLVSLVLYNEVKSYGLMSTYYAGAVKSMKDLMIPLKRSHRWVCDDVGMRRDEDTCPQKNTQIMIQIENFHAVSCRG